MNSHSAHARANPITIALLLLALVLSGIAAIVNQTVWQRALKIYLAGCESTSSMIIVLVFMLGLGSGALCMGLAAHRVKNPLRALAWVELTLLVVNLGIAAILAMDISESVYAFQRLAMSLGVPLRLVYGVSAAAVLLLPCFLMGITMPLVSEVAQRQLRYQTNSFLALLFALNTLGSVLGGLASGFLLMPFFGQKISLLVGASCNGAAAAILFGLYLQRYSGAVWPAPEKELRLRKGRLSPEEIMSFWLGFFSLGYEMYLFRIAALAHEPLPYNFSLVLCYYLFFWSAGVFLAKRIRQSIPMLLVLSAALVAAIPAFFLIDRFELHGIVLYKLHISLPLLISALVYCLPCIAFGCLFGQLLSRAANHWGNDVGRYYGLNTLGSCFGILLMTLVGFEMNHTYTALLIASGYIALYFYSRKSLSLPLPVGGDKLWTRLGAVGFSVCLLILLPFTLVYNFKVADPVGYLVKVLSKNEGGKIGNRVLGLKWDSYFGKSGVIEVDEDGNMIWDGLWHSRLAVNGDHVGSSNWLMAAIPYLCHTQDPMDALVIGLGTGITATTLARSDRVNSVDVYEVDHKLLTILNNYPEGTLHAGESRKLHLIWQDGRAGVALNEKQYDLITQQPLYLKQAGSSILLSREYLELIKKRLKKNGVFCIYSNAFGNQEQALLVRRTVDSVFPYCESFGKGYMIVAANSPFSFDAHRITDAQNPDLLTQEMISFGVQKIKDYKDSPRLEWKNCPYVISDNLPLVEYPGVVRSLLADPRQ